jgi:hypothetical protein
MQSGLSTLGIRFRYCRYRKSCTNCSGIMDVSNYLCTAEEWSSCSGENILRLLLVHCTGVIPSVSFQWMTTAAPRRTCEWNEIQLIGRWSWRGPKLLVRKRDQQFSLCFYTRICRYTRTRLHAEASGCQSSNRSDQYVLLVRPVCNIHRLNQKSSSREGSRQRKSVLGWSSIGRPARFTSKHHRDEGRQEIRVWKKSS